jgi:threonine dehydrogenase-like Zn-dependent dehydrogenase
VGAEQVINIEEFPDAAKRNEKIMDLTNGLGPDLVVEASGVPIALGEGLDIIRRGDRYLVIGQTTPQGIIKMSSASVVWKNLEIIGQCSADINHYCKALQIIKNNRERFNFGDIITHKYSLKDINIAYASKLAGTDIKLPRSLKSLR